MDEETDDTELGTLGAIRDQLTDIADPATTPEAQGYARKFLDRQLNSPIAGKQNEILTQLEKQSAEAQSVLRAARQKLMARRYNPADKWYALSAALGAPTKVGGVGELASRAAEALQGSANRAEAYDTSQEKEALGYDEQISKLGMDLLGLKSKILTGQGKDDVELAKESLKTLGKRVTGPQSVQNKAQQAVDREFAKDYTAWIQQGAPESEKSQVELGMARDRLRGYKVGENGERIPLKEDDYLTRTLGPTGKVSGTLATIPGVGKALQDLTMPGASDIREVVESTVQRSLRPILGAQFTEKEGERLIARVYNPRLRPEVNAARVDRLLKQVSEAAANKTRASQWFEQHGTLQGFQGKFNYSMTDFMPKDVNELAPRQAEEEADPGDDLPAIDPNNPAPPPDESRPLFNGKPVYRLDELPKKVKKKGIFGFAEGGAVAKPDTIYVQMPDGTLQEAAADASQEDLGLGEPDSSYDPAISRASLAALGAGTGYLAGRTLHSAATGIKDVATRQRETPAQSRLLRIMEDSGMPPDQVTAQARRFRRLGVPAMPLDASPNLRAAVETALPQGGSESVDLMDRLNERQAGARERTMDQVNRGLKPDEYFSKEDELKEKLYGSPGNPSDSTKAYQEAFSQNPTVASKQLGRLLDTPSGSKAVKNAIKTMKDKGMPIGKVNAVTGAVMNPSLEFLNQVKKEMDDLITKEEAQGPTGKGKTLRELRNSFRNELDTATTDPATGTSPYAEARKTWETDKSHLDALKSGREEFGTMQPEEVRRAVTDMNFEQKDAFRTGVAQKLSEMLNSPTTDINAAKKLIGSPAMQSKLSALFDNPNEFRVFQTALEKEMDMFDTGQQLLGKESSIRKRGAEPAEGLVARGAEKAPALGIFSPTHWALKYLRKKPEIDAGQAREVISLMKSSTPEELANFEAKLGPKFGRAALRKKRAGKMGMAGAALGTLIGAMSGGSDDEGTPPENDPALVGLTPEEREMALRPAKAKGGKIDQAKELIEALRAKNAEMPMDTETLKHHIFNISSKIGEMPNTVWKMFNGVDQGASTPIPNPAMRGMVPVTPTRVPAQPEQLAPFARSMDFEKARLKQLVDSLNQRPDLPPGLRENLQSSGLAANTAYDKMLTDPSYDNMNRLSELVRSLSEQAKRRGGAIRRQFGGMTTHG